MGTQFRSQDIGLTRAGGFGFEHSWSMALHWRQLVANPIRPISCKHQTPKEPAFYFQAEAIFNAKDPSTRSVGRPRIV